MKNTPSFWYPAHGRLSSKAILLWPLTLLWRLGAFLKTITASPYKPKIPTIVIGNITAGGTGKTPIVKALYEMAKKNGRHPVILTRGYGGCTIGPYLAKNNDQLADIGDEARLMVREAPVVISRNRGKGAKWIEENIPQCDLIIMDDGMQNKTITPDCRIAVFNGALGIGNGMLIPSGPLREGLSALKTCDAVIITGEDKYKLAHSIKAFKKNLLVLSAMRALNKKDLTVLKSRRVIAFAGIGDPNNFFRMLSLDKIDVINDHDFPDHHPYTIAEIMTLKDEAKTKDAVLVTTEKDFMRLTPEMAEGINIVRLETSLDDNVMSILPRTQTDRI